MRYTVLCAPTVTAWKIPDKLTASTMPAAVWYKIILKIRISNFKKI